MARRRKSMGGVAGFIVLAALIGLSNMRGQHPNPTAFETPSQSNQSPQAESPKPVAAPKETPTAQPQTNNSVVTPTGSQQSFANMPRRKMFVVVEKLNVRATPDPLGKKTAALTKGLESL